MCRGRMRRPKWTWWRVTVAITVAMVVAGIGGGPALADATAGRNAVHFNLLCGDAELTVVSPSEPSAVAQVVGSNSTLVAADATLTTTYTDPQSGESVTEVRQFLFGPAHGQSNGVQDRLVTCGDTVTVDDPTVGPMTVSLVGNFLFAA